MPDLHAGNAGTVNKLDRYIIINADDFGYFDCVSRGILDCADAGVVTATGIFANSPFLEKHLEWLKQYDRLDIGVHLNLTSRLPITSTLREKLRESNGQFPGKFTMVRMIMTRQVTPDDLVLELRAQIERCLSAGINVCFLNSHEHIHMLPPVFRIVQELAAEYGILHVRLPLPEANCSYKSDSFVRDSALRLLGGYNRKITGLPVLPFLGLSASGKLNFAYLGCIFVDLKPGIYELMCHPGACSTDEISDPDLLQYHDWKGELDFLVSDEFHVLCQKENIRLIGYRDISIEAGILKVNDIKHEFFGKNPYREETG